MLFIGKIPMTLPPHTTHQSGAEDGEGDPRQEEEAGEKGARQGCCAFKRCGWATAAEKGPGGGHGALAGALSRAGLCSVTVRGRVRCLGHLLACVSLMV